MQPSRLALLMLRVKVLAEWVQEVDHMVPAMAVQVCPGEQRFPEEDIERTKGKK